VIELIDSHAHLQGAEFESDREAVIERSQAAGVGTIVVPAVDLASAQAAISLARRYAAVYATAGCHPHEAKDCGPAAVAAIEALLDAPEAIAVGEIGLDFYRMHSSRPQQLAIFAAMLALAARRALPVVVHCRDAWEEMLPILEAWSKGVGQSFDGRPLGVMHYFTGSAAIALRYVELGLLVSIHTSVTHPKAAALREVAATLPLESLLIETDSPYGAPQAQRGRRNEPAYVVEAAKAIAALRGLSLAAVAAATTANARRLFRLDSTSLPRAATEARV